jgi:hypothetical protein
MWVKKGLIFNTDRDRSWMISHACVPTATVLANGNIRIYFAPRNSQGQSIPTFIDVDGQDFSKVVYLHDRPILDLGRLGTFDDGGIMPCSIVEHESLLYLYYVGWNPSVSVPYRNAIGLAISKDGGTTFERAFEGPIVDRNPLEPFFTASPCVYKENGNWHMWYASSIGFSIVNDKPEPIYVIKYASSSDGMSWTRNNITCIHQKNEFEANARPTVIKEGDTYKMWFTFRGSFDYRDGKDSYRVGYAESSDAVNWNRMDEKAGIDVSTEGWDSRMITYPNVITHGNKKVIFYNGNGFGKTGIGYAIYKTDNL